MKNYKIETILAAIDLSDNAKKVLFESILIAKKNNAKLVLLHVAEIDAYTIPAEMFSLGIYTEQIFNDSKDYLKKMAKRIEKEEHIKVDYVCYNGNVYENIIRAAHISNADLIVMGTHGTSGIKEWLFGSNAFNVVNYTNTPVLSINVSTNIQYHRNIVFPYNRNLLSIKKIDHVIEIAKIFNATVLFLGYTESRYTSVITAIRKKGEELAGILNEQNIRTSVDVVVGDNYANEILLYAQEKNADMITVITNRSNNEDKILKSRPDKRLVNHSTIPVLSVPVE